MRKNLFYPLAMSFALALPFAATPASAGIISTLPSEFAGLPEDNSAFDGLLGDIQYFSSLVFNSFNGQPSDRDDPASAFGPPNGDFFEIGWREVVIYGIEDAVNDGVFTIWERTDGNVGNWPESARILAGNSNGGIFEFVGDVTNLQAQDGYSFTFSFADPVNAFLIQDVSPQLPFSFDPRAGRVAEIVHDVPAPASLALMAFGIPLFMRRRKRNPA